MMSRSGKTRQRCVDKEMFVRNKHLSCRLNLALRVSAFLESTASPHKDSMVILGHDARSGVCNYRSGFDEHAVGLC